MVIDHSFYMGLALKEAWRYQGLTYPNPAVGAAIVSRDGQLLSVEAHQKAGAPHAEVNAFKAAFLSRCSNDSLRVSLQNLSDANEIHDFLAIHHGDLFKGATLYVTLEPCMHFGKTPPCALLAHKMGISKLIMGVRDPNAQAAGGASYLLSKGIEVIDGICEEEAMTLLTPFMKWQEEQFIFFKHAQHLNGTYDTGVVSSLSSRRDVHALRDCVDLMIIGGKTVREDRPTLDARLVGGRAPDVMILSTQEHMDESIPLFLVPNRKVWITSKLEIPNRYRYIMIEGGPAFLECVKDIVDWHLLYLTTKTAIGQHFNTPLKSHIVHVEHDDDLKVWLKRS